MGTVPWPDKRSTASGMEELAVNVRFAEKNPAVVGANETVNVQGAPAGSALPQGLALGTVKRAVELAMLLIFSDEFAVPQLVTVTVRDLELPATTSPKKSPALLEPKHKAGTPTEASITAANPKTGWVFGAGGVTDCKKALGLM